MVPFGQESIKRTLGVIEISNTSKAWYAAIADYDIMYADDTGLCETYKIKNFKRSRRVLGLLLESIKKIIELQTKQGDNRDT
jgi:hypothetical protein